MTTTCAPPSNSGRDTASGPRLYRTRFLGHPFTLRGLTQLVFLARFERRAIRQLLEAPAPIVAFDEPGDGGAHFGQVSEDPAVDCLLLERAIPALDDPVGFRLFEEAEAGVDAPVSPCPTGPGAARRRRRTAADDRAHGRQSPRPGHPDYALVELK